MHDWNFSDLQQQHVWKLAALGAGLAAIGAVLVIGRSVVQPLSYCPPARSYLENSTNIHRCSSCRSVALFAVVVAMIG